ncbi:MAG: hypothetical protein EOO87_18280 [Pedobacter sp.]|nr:MAG: hypothetical protein EOO87_18280 [Pedobacter sp.]
MKKILSLIIFFSLTFAIFSCKKEDVNDPTVYHWKRELVSNVALNPLNNIDDSKIYVVSTDFLYLTNAQMEEQKKSKRRDGTVFYYRFTRVDTE